MKKILSAPEKKALTDTLKKRFEENMQRHKKISWKQVEARLGISNGKLWSLDQMEQTGGEPDVIGIDKKSGELIFVDCAPESPKGRRSYCYDTEALESRKEHKPKNSALGAAAEMGITLLTEEQYYELQQIEEFDTKTSSWLQTTDDVREKGGAIFGDRRFGRVFVYHNGAESYYGSRGFRAMLKL